MKTAIIAAALLAVAALGVAQEQSIDFTPIACVRAGEMPVLQPRLNQPGDLRAFFRRVNTTDWCSVEGKNEGVLSSVILPKFAAGDEVEFFFLLLDGKRVVARSPQIYRVKVSDRCDTPVARHVTMLTMDCSAGGANGIASSLGAGYALKNTQYTGFPNPASPDRP